MADDLLAQIEAAAGALNRPLLSCIIMRRAEYETLVEGAEASTLMGALLGVQVCARDTLPDGLVYILEYTNGVKDLVRIDGQVTRIKVPPIFGAGGFWNG